MSYDVEVRIHPIATDGLPDMNANDRALVNRVAFIFDGSIVSGWPISEQDPRWSHGDGQLWEANDDVGNYQPKAGVTHWVEFPEPLHRYERVPLPPPHERRFPSSDDDPQTRLIDGLRSACAFLGEHGKAVQAELATVRQQLDQAGAERDFLTRQVQAAQSERDDLRVALHNSKTQVTQAVNDMLSMRGQRDAALAELMDMKKDHAARVAVVEQLQAQRDAWFKDQVAKGEGFGSPPSEPWIPSSPIDDIRRAFNALKAHGPEFDSADFWRRLIAVRERHSSPPAPEPDTPEGA